MRGMPAHQCVPAPEPARTLSAIALDPERPEYHRATVRPLATAGPTTTTGEGMWIATAAAAHVGLEAQSTGAQASSRLMR